MKNLLLIIVFLAIATLSRAQHYPQRTPEDIALKQTVMMMRELQISDTAVRDTLYRLHLKFVLKRAVSNTRAEAMQYIQDFNAELQHILTPAQYQKFMNQQVNHEPHRHKNPYSRIMPNTRDSAPPPPPPHGHDEEIHTPPPPPEHQP